MKKKFFIGVAMSLFAVATVFNMNITEQGNADDVSLEAAATMAEAQSESGQTEKPSSKWYRFGTWTWVEETKEVEVTAKAKGYVIVKGALVKVDVGTKYTKTQTYHKWDCIGWSGDC